jgi:membrane protease YdiL (CAAX protease family)
VSPTVSPSASARTGTVDRLVGLVGHNPVPAFFAITFLWTWGYDLLLYAVAGPSPPMFAPPTTVPRTWGPLLAAAAVLRARGTSVRGFLRTVVAVATRWWLLPAALLLPVAFGEVEALVAAATGGAVSLPAYSPPVYLLSFLLVFLFAGALEEFGWRAFAQPALQNRYPAVAVALGIGAVWASWHLPLFLLFDLQPYDPASLPTYYLALMADSVILAWLFNATGSVLVPMAFHAAGNMPALATVSGSLPGALWVVDEHGYLLATAALALVLVATVGVGLARESLSGTRGRPAAAERSE